MQLQQDLTQYVEQLFAHLGMEWQGIDVSIDESNQVADVQVTVSDVESGMLIGFHGDTILSLQKLLNASFGEQGFLIRVNVNDYRQRREEVVVELAKKVASKVKQINKPQTIPHLPANERLIVHMTLKDDQQVTTYSQGEGAQRRLIVAPANNVSAN